MSKIVCTYEDYDKMCEKFRIMRFQAEDYAPTLWDFSEYIEKNPAKYIDFLIWIDVTGITTEENKEARKMVRKFLCENLVLVDSLETEDTKCLRFMQKNQIWVLKSRRHYSGFRWKMV